MAKKWYDYFDQETMDLTYEMYKMDFEVCGYDTAMQTKPLRKRMSSLKATTSHPT